MRKQPKRTDLIFSISKLKKQVYLQNPLTERNAKKKKEN